MPIRSSKVVVRIPESGARTVNNRHMPDVNVQFMVASILIEGKLTFESAHDYERFQNPRVLALKEKVQLIGDERDGTIRPSIPGPGRSDASRTAGVVREHVIDCRGRPENPMSPEEVEKESRMVDGAGAGEEECRADYRVGPAHRVDKQRSRSHQATGGSLTAIDHCRILEMGSMTIK